MARPATRSELLAAIDTEFDRLFGFVSEVPDFARQVPGACEEWSVKDVLAHLDAWHEMFLEWERVGSKGGTADMPAAGYSWSETPALNAEIWERTKSDSWEDVVERVMSSHDRVRAVVAGYTNDDLFTKRRYAWTGSTSVGSYAVSATSSHYAWASKLLKAYLKTL